MTPPSAPPSDRPRPARWPFALGALLLGGCLYVAVVNVIEARRWDGDAASVGQLRTITTAQALFCEGDKDGDGRKDYAVSLEELGRAGLIDPALASGTKRGYVLRILAADERTWSATASPHAPSPDGDRWYFVDESDVIRFATTPAVGPTSTPIGG